MKMEYRFQLKQGSQIKCPSCGKKRFSPYIDNITEIPLDENSCGRCSRENNCEYHYPPRKFFKDHPEYRKDFFQNSNNYETVVEEVPISFIDIENVKRTRNRQYENLTYFLERVYGKEEVEKVIELYLIGFENNQIIFWQIDGDGDVRTGKKVLYTTSGKRKSMYLLHKSLGEEDYVIEECFFGEHLIQEYPEKDIMVVESEKTCLIASIVFPELIWIATGGKRKYLETSWPALGNRNITLVPDEDAIEEWTEFKEELELQLPYQSISINDICKDEDPQCDIGDLILKWTAKKKKKNSDRNFKRKAV